MIGLMESGIIKAGAILKENTQARVYINPIFHQTPGIIPLNLI